MAAVTAMFEGGLSCSAAGPGKGAGREWRYATLGRGFAGGGGGSTGGRDFPRLVEPLVNSYAGGSGSVACRRCRATCTR
ncbi:MAG: hypothetical protein EOO63_18610 [Hymenobacter sp.]|nr:MAG: hypothetical protein EOO63_18610 [Hymenobacter sp.]